MNMTPHILLCGEPRQFPNYESALTAAGAVVRFLGEGADYDGLLLPGGGDIHPSRYGAAVENCQGVDQERDALELETFRQALEAGKPVFGICRGVQLLNVALGGTLHQHVEGHSKVDGVDGLHATRAEGFVEKIYGRRFMVNSAHHQALDRLGRGLRAVQWAEDGVVEAVEHRSLPIWGVQWHPERLEEGWRCRDTVDGLRILRFFVSQCG